MSFFDEIDDSAEGVEERMETGGLLPPGFYRARLHGAKEVESKSKGTPGYELTFVVIGGPFDGREVSDTLWKVDNQFCKDRIKLAMIRLGLRKMSPDNKRMLPVEGKNDFVDCLDAELVIEVIHEPDQKDENKKWVRLAPNGFHDPNSSKVKDILARGGKPIGKGKDGKEDKTAKPAKSEATAATATTSTKPTENRRDVRRL